MPEDTRMVLFDFALHSAASEWQAVNDGVMGGVSQGTFEITDRKTLAFVGRLSLENNGGFASVRTRAKKPGLESGDALRVRVRGDGRVYSLNLYVPRPQVAFSYRATVTTTDGEWVEITLPLDKFEATSFGRPVDAGPVDPREVSALGFMVSDKKAGPTGNRVGQGGAVGTVMPQNGVGGRRSNHAELDFSRRPGRSRLRRGGSPPSAGTTGLYHTAVLYPTRRALAVALRRVLEAGVVLDGAADHGVSEALYLRDPDENGVELYWDRPSELWPRRPTGELAMFTRRLDLTGLLTEADAATVEEGPRDL